MLAHAAPLMPGAASPPTMKDAIETTEFGEYRGNCLYCHRQNWCGVGHTSVYCPFRLVTMHPGKVHTFLGLK